MSVGESEKNADSAAETNATITSNTSMEIIANKILKEKDFTIMLKSKEVFNTKCKPIGTSKIRFFVKQLCSKQRYCFALNIAF
jgi:hypothetical protein